MLRVVNSRASSIEHFRTSLMSFAASARFSSAEIWERKTLKDSGDAGLSCASTTGWMPLGTSTASFAAGAGPALCGTEAETGGGGVATGGGAFWTGAGTGAGSFGATGDAGCGAAATGLTDDGIGNRPVVPVEIRTAAGTVGMGPIPDLAAGDAGATPACGTRPGPEAAGGNEASTGSGGLPAAGAGNRPVVPVEIRTAAGTVGMGPIPDLAAGADAPAAGTGGFTAAGIGNRPVVPVEIRTAAGTVGMGPIPDLAAGAPDPVPAGFAGAAPGLAAPGTVIRVVIVGTREDDLAARAISSDVRRTVGDTRRAAGRERPPAPGLP